MQAAIDSLPDPVVIFGVEGDVSNVNRPAETLLGFGSELGAKDSQSNVDPSVREVLDRMRAHVLSGKGAYTPKGFEEAFRARTTEGERYFLPRAIPVYESKAGIVGATVILQDVTRLRRFSELKDDLVATVAHEFRTPLTSLRMAIHLCLEQMVGPLTEKQSDLLHAAREDCERLQSMVDDILDLSRIKEGQIEMHRRPISLPIKRPTARSWSIRSALPWCSQTSSTMRFATPRAVEASTCGRCRPTGSYVLKFRIREKESSRNTNDTSLNDIFACPARIRRAQGWASPSPRKWWKHMGDRSGSKVNWETAARFGLPYLALIERNREEDHEHD